MESPTLRWSAIVGPPTGRDVADETRLALGVAAIGGPLFVKGRIVVKAKGIGYRRRLRRAKATLCGLLLTAAGGCAVDYSSLTVDLAEAALTSVSNSLVNALSTHLNGD